MSRKCADCQLCCRLLPVVELGKPANQKCQHQKFGAGCTIYDRCPPSCRLWSCQWLMGGEDTESLRRPDRAHYAVDIMPDFIKLAAADGKVTEIPVVQVWLDPRHPQAWRDASLKAYLAKRGVKGFAALIRRGSKEGFVMFPPAMTSNGEWAIVTSSRGEAQHSPDQVLAALSKNGLGIEMELKAESRSNEGAAQ